MTAGYPYDERVLTELAARLYAALPAMYRIPDEGPSGQGELRDFVEVLATPLAILRQSIEELHADLFIDTADDRMLPALAEMVGMSLAFPDPLSNRRDVRGTVGWRRRKGTPAALQEMASELTGQTVTLQEGWRRVQMAQELDLPRRDRQVLDLRPGIVAEQVDGPLDVASHVVDVRPLSQRTGRYHPRHVAHWLHATTTFPLTGATALDVTPKGSGVVFTLSPLGVRQPVRARRTGEDRSAFTDRIQPRHFAADPGRWFGAQGGLDVRVCGLPAALGEAVSAERVAHTRPADASLVDDVVLDALAVPPRGWRGAVRVDVGLATVTAPSPDVWHVEPASFRPRATVELDASGVVRSTRASAPVSGQRVPLLRLRPADGASARYFPGAVLACVSRAPDATAAALDSKLAREGFLRGVLHLEVPPLEPGAERLLYISGDGSLYDVRSPDGAVVEMSTEGELLVLGGEQVATGPGPAWPPLPSSAEPRMLSRLPAAPGCGPVVMHGALALRRNEDGTMAKVPASSTCALTFAVQLDKPGGPDFRPFQRLSWTGPEPTASATWTALDRRGEPVAASDLAREYAVVARLRRTDGHRMALAVRFECSSADATLCPGEVAWTADDGTTTLIHLPQLQVETLRGKRSVWGTETVLRFASEPVRVAEDGSTWAYDAAANRRRSLGAVAPIAQAPGLRRRRARGRLLPPYEVLEAAASSGDEVSGHAGSLDLDVTQGLFCFAAGEPPQSRSVGPDGTAPPSVTSSYQEGATMHVGARPAAREPVLDERLPRPTRLVSRSGTLHPDAPAEWHSIPRYGSLAAALAAVSERWRSLRPSDAGEVAEVVQFEDSATYDAERPVWPQGPDNPEAASRIGLSLTVQAAERVRPTVLVDAGHGWPLPGTMPRYASLTLRGIALGGAGWTGMTLPAADTVRLELCTVLHAENHLQFAEQPEVTHVCVMRCETAGLGLAGAGVLEVRDSVVDSNGGAAVTAPAGRAVLERVSVGGRVNVRVLDATEVIFADRVLVEDRFQGCVRYSRVSSDSVLPRIHKVTWDTPVRLVSHHRRDPGWWRLSADCDSAITGGAADGSELGAFGGSRLGERLAGLSRRLDEFTPVGLVTGIIRID